MVNRLISIKAPSLLHAAKYFTLYNDSELNYLDRTTSLKQWKARGCFQLPRQSDTLIFTHNRNRHKSPKIITSTVDNGIFEIIRFRKIIRSRLARESQFPERKDADKYSQIPAFIALLLYDVIEIAFNATSV